MIKSQKNILISVLALGTFCITNTEMGIMGILPLISQQFQVSIARAGEMVSFFALIISFSGPFLPALLSRFNKKKIMLLAIGLFVISCLASAFITNFTLLLVVRVLPAFLHPVFVSYAMSMATQIADNEAEATKLVSKVFVGISAGMVLGVPIANLVANYGSFQLVMLTFAAVNVVIGIACAVYLPAFIEVSSVSFRQQMQALIQLPTIISMVIIICLNGAVFGFYSYLSDFLSKASSVSSLLISFLLLIYGLANVLGNEVAGRLLASIPQKILLVLPILMIVPYLLLYLCHQNLILIFFLIMVTGGFSGMTQNLNQYIMNDTLASTPDLANGLFITGANLGTTLGSMVCGQFIIRWGTVSSLFATIFFLIMGIVVIWIQKLLIKF